MFTKDKKGTFKYTFAHWAAYQMTALNLGCWKFRFLFHDVEKPLLKMLGFKYERVRNIHRRHARHHLAYRNPENIDWLGLVIDWECSRFTKLDAPLNARGTMEAMCKNAKYDDVVKARIRENVTPILDMLGL